MPESLPPWERGLKSIQSCQSHTRHPVAPPVGAWIEIIKLQKPQPVIQVAPPVGAWIEIMWQAVSARLQSVAPPVGAWIEICNKCCHIYHFSSLPPWERGLK